jgi:hypothetical protein
MDAEMVLFAAAGDDEPEVAAYLDRVAAGFGDPSRSGPSFTAGSRPARSPTTCARSPVPSCA